MKHSEKEIADIFEKKHKMFRELSVKLNPLGKKMIFSCEIPGDVEAFINYPCNSDRESYPVVFNLHGGAFADGDAVTMDSFCQMLADRMGVMVVNLNYKLFPEVKYPYPVDETVALLQYIRNHADSLKADVTGIGVCGFSAGASIAFGAEVQLLEKEEKGFDFLIGAYPMTSGRLEDVDKDSPYQATDEILTDAMLYAMDGLEDSPVCSCLLAEDDILQKFPPTIIFTCGKDSLGPMGRSFSGRLAENGVTVISKCYNDALHGFVEVNRPDFIFPDDRKNDIQERYTKDAENFICIGMDMLKKMSVK